MTPAQRTRKIASVRADLQAVIVRLDALADDFEKQIGKTAAEREAWEQTVRSLTRAVQARDALEGL